MMRSWEVGGGGKRMRHRRGRVWLRWRRCIWDYQRRCLTGVSSEGTAFDTPSFCRLQAMILVLHVVVVVVIVIE
jgi:hypothetical protein